jgi:uncharacterized repeat protein (TIGR03803 family)
MFCMVQVMGGHSIIGSPRFALLLALAAPAAWAASAQEAVIYNFATTPGDAESPTASLTLGPDGNFYGTSQGGGPFLGGTVFKITPAGLESVLYSFGSIPGDGDNPVASLIEASDGAFYGTTWWGGQHGHGTVFRISPLGAYEQLLSFGTTDADGNGPFGTLVEGADGDLYGTTLDGGPYQTQGWGGTLFKISKAGVYSQLYTFGVAPSDGQWPFAGLTLGSDGNFYGTTFFSGPRGGPPNGGGTVFRLVPSQGLTTIHDFNNAATCGDDGGAPEGAMTLGLDGSLYGTTLDGGKFRRGTIFRITPDGKETVLYSFGSIPSDGREPTGKLLQLADGTLLGTTTLGGANEGPDNAGGTAFMLAPDGTYTLLHSFGATPTDGQFPFAGITQGPDGNFYGTTVAGGSTTDRANGNVGAGTVYKLVIDKDGTGAPTFHSTPVPQYGCPARSGGGKGGSMDLGLILVALGALTLRRRSNRPAIG